MCRRGVFVSQLTVFVSRRCMVLCVLVLAHGVMVLSLMMMMRGGVMMGGGSTMMLLRRMLR
jgi:hypothetical protein